MYFLSPCSVLGIISCNSKNICQYLVLWENYGKVLWTAVIHGNYFRKLGNIMANNFAVTLIASQAEALVLHTCSCKCFKWFLRKFQYYIRRSPTFHVPQRMCKKVSMFHLRPDLLKLRNVEIPLYLNFCLTSVIYPMGLIQLTLSSRSKVQFTFNSR